MSTSFPVRLRTLALIALIGGGIGVQPAHAAACATPVPSAPASARGSTNTVTWTHVTGTLEGNGFTVEVSTSGALKVDGSFVTVTQTATPPLGARSRTFNNLAEQTHYYHVRARPSATCATGAWSEIVSTTQDATPPAVTVDQPSRPITVMESLTVSGTAVDVPAPSATVASGTREVVVALDNQIAPLAARHERPSAQATVDAGGVWRATFADVPLGIYVVSAVATDVAGNSSEPATTQIVVVGEP